MESVNVKVPGQVITLLTGTNKTTGANWVMTDFLARPSWAPETIIKAQIGGDKKALVEGLMATDGTLEIESKNFNQQHGTFRLFLPKRQTAPYAGGGSAGAGQVDPDRRPPHRGAVLSPEAYFAAVARAAQELRSALVYGVPPTDPAVEAAFIEGTSKLVAQYIMCVERGVVELEPKAATAEDEISPVALMDEINDISVTHEQLVALRDRVLEHKGMVAAEKLAALTQIKRRIEAMQGV